jgi:hypothetical protein
MSAAGTKGQRQVRTMVWDKKKADKAINKFEMRFRPQKLARDAAISGIEAILCRFVLDDGLSPEQRIDERNREFAWMLGTYLLYCPGMSLMNPARQT